MNRSTALFDWELSQPDKTCVITDHERYTYADVCAAIRAAASALADRITPGTRVGLFIDSTPNFLLYQYTVFYLGGVVTPINRAMTADEVRQVVERLEIPLVITDTTLDLAGAATVHRVTGEFDMPAMGAPVDAADLGIDAPAMLLQTSGSTGVPKGVLLDQRNLLANYDPTYRWIGVGRDDVLLLTLPIFNTYALNQGINMLAMSGGTMRLLRRFLPDAVATALAEDRPTFLPLVPTMLTRMRQADIRHDAPIKVGIGAAPSPAKIVDDAWTVFPQAHLYMGYGLTEATAIVSLNHIGTPEHHHDDWASTGPIVTGIKARIDDPEEPDGRGEILVKGDAILRSYVGTDDPIPVRDGWLRTGDVGYFHDGRLNIVDRIRELIIRGGQNIYPGEIERILSRHPAVLEAAAVGRPDADLGEVPTAFVVLRHGATATPVELRDWIGTHLATFKIPETVTILPSLPKTPTGKVQKRDLRDRALITPPSNGTAEG